MPKAKSEDIDRYLKAIKIGLERYQINTPLRVAHFIAQIAHESGSFRYSSENLNYSANALRSVFGKYFKTNEEADRYARKPEKIANRVYGGRMGNGDEATGEGWKFRGRGLIQLTGKENYQKCARAIGKNIDEEPDKLASDPEAAVLAAGWFWDSRKLNDHADKDDVLTITRRINGGTHGLDDRKAYLARAKKALGLA
ncbi:MAG: glycoside hydrolase family 19 protein [bacterium]